MEQAEFVMVGIAISGLLSVGLSILAPDQVFRLKIDRATLAGLGLVLIAVGFGVGAIVGGLT